MNPALTGAAVTAVAAAAGCGTLSPAVPPPAGADAAHTRFVTDDIARFWKAFDRLGPSTTVDEADRIFVEEYFGQASEGLVAFIQARPRVRALMAETVLGKRAYYASIRANTLAVTDALPAIRASLARLQDLYPPARFPPVYFLVGVLQTGGTATGDKLLIGVEHWTRAPDSPVDGLSAWQRAGTFGPGELPGIVVHELVHVLQRQPPRSTLLDQVVREGMASFLAELATGKRSERALYEYGEAHEGPLWVEFVREMHERDRSRWLYEGDRRNDGRPADLGYFVGHQICAAYYRRATDKRRAVAEMLTVDDTRRFLEASGYDGK